MPKLPCEITVAMIKYGGIFFDFSNRAKEAQFFRKNLTSVYLCGKVIKTFTQIIPVPMILVFPENMPAPLSLHLSLKIHTLC